MDYSILAVQFPSGVRIAAYVISFLILWVIVSIPVYFAARIVVGGRARFGRALLATLVGPIAFGIILAIGYFFTARLSGAFGILALLLAFLAWIWVYKVVFGTGWLRALGIAILSVIVALVIIAILAFVGFAFREIFFFLLGGAHGLEQLGIPAALRAFFSD